MLVRKRVPVLPGNPGRKQHRDSLMFPSEMRSEGPITKLSESHLASSADCRLPQPRARLEISPDKNHQTGTRAPISRDYAWTGCSLLQAGSEPLAGQSTNQRWPGRLSRHPLTAPKKKCTGWDPALASEGTRLPLSFSLCIPFRESNEKKTLFLYALLVRLHESCMTFLERDLAMCTENLKNMRILAQQIPLLGACPKEAICGVNKNGHAQTLTIVQPKTAKNWK